MTALDWFIRGATIGLCLLLATRWLFHDRRLTARLGALFVAGVACYVLVSAPGVELLPTPLVVAIHGVAIFNIVFFWWFALSLFEEELRWQIQRWIPPVALLMTLPFRAWHSSAEGAQWVGPAHQLVVVTLILHVVYLAIRDFNGDLVEARRRFRCTVATLIPILALAVVVVETGLFGIRISNDLLLLQAITLFLLVGGFAHWMLLPRKDLFAEHLVQGDDKIQLHEPLQSSTNPAMVHNESTPIAEDRQDRAGASSIDRLEIDRLLKLMVSGVYRKPGLTVGGLANELSIPEHRLRKLINEQLGHRNFTAYLNEYRISEVKSRLADPASARIQIAQIAYEAGFNSIGPFNRAFRQATEQTPTEFRRQALADFAES